MRKTLKHKSVYSCVFKDRKKRFDSTHFVVAILKEK